MEDIKITHGKLSAPNLINICVDCQELGELSGRFYHHYSEEPVRFKNIVELLREMENLFDTINFPQASTKTRSLMEQENSSVSSRLKPEKKLSGEVLEQFSGEKGTFLTNIKFRQNSTWQGQLQWMEKNVLQEFSNTLEFLKLLDTNLTES